MLLRLIPVLLVTVLISSCDTPAGRLRHAEKIGRSHQLHRLQIPTGRFTLTAFVRRGDPDKPIDVYIEGDGFAWVTRHQISMDPTPIHPVTLELAALDPAANVIYLARPCQYQGVSTNPACTNIMWTDQRFSPAVIDATNAAINALIKPGMKINLVGYSGGAAVAALVAARRDDILTLRTVGGNLDTALFTDLHHLTPMRGSLNPVSVADKLRDIPQLHLVGGKDRVIPKSIAESFVRKQGDGHCASIRVVPGVSHGKGWQAQWPALLRLPLACH